MVAHRGGVPFPRDTSTGAGAIILLFAFAACVVAVVYTCCGGWVGAGNESDEKEDMIQGGNLDHSVLINGSLSGSVQSNGSVGSQDDVGVEWGSGEGGKSRGRGGRGGARLHPHGSNRSNISNGSLSKISNADSKIESGGGASVAAGRLKEREQLGGTAAAAAVDLAICGVGRGTAEMGGAVSGGGRGVFTTPPATPQHRCLVQESQMTKGKSYSCAYYRGLLIIQGWMQVLPCGILFRSIAGATGRWVRVVRFCDLCSVERTTTFAGMVPNAIAMMVLKPNEIESSEVESGHEIECSTDEDSYEPEDELNPMESSRVRNKSGVAAAACGASPAAAEQTKVFIGSFTRRNECVAEIRHAWRAHAVGHRTLPWYEAE